MASINKDQVGSSLLFRAYRAFFILTVLAYVVSPFADDLFVLYQAQAAGGFDQADFQSAVRISLAMHGLQSLFHVVGCAVTVGLVVWQAQDEDGSTYLLAPLIAAVFVFAVGFADLLIAVPTIDPLTRAAIISLEGNAPMLYLADSFGVLGISGHLTIATFFILLAGIGQLLKMRMHAATTANESARGQRPEGWSKKGA